MSGYQSHSAMTPLVDRELARRSEYLWERHPNLRPSAGRYQLFRSDGKWRWQNKGFKVEVSSCEAEDAICGKLMASFFRMWSNIKMHQKDEGHTTVFYVECDGGIRKGFGSGLSPALALIDAWLAQEEDK